MQNFSHNANRAPMRVETMIVLVFALIALGGFGTIAAMIAIGMFL